MSSIVVIDTMKIMALSASLFSWEQHRHMNSNSCKPIYETEAQNFSAPLAYMHSEHTYKAMY
jgi:hypothetical protein